MSSPKADVCGANRHVWFGPEADTRAAHPACDRNFASVSQLTDSLCDPDDYLSRGVLPSPLLKQNTKRLGRDVRTLHDAAGSAFGEDMYRSAKEGQISEVAFKSPVPGSTERVSKQAYVTAIGDQICGVSSYLGNNKPQR
jgi:hypothetical protein